MGVGVEPPPAPPNPAACPCPPPAVRSPEGKIRLYCKGADTILLERLHPLNQDLSNVTTDHLNVSGAGTAARAGSSPVPGGREGPGATARLCPAPSAACLQEYAGEGLRTLVLAYKDLEESYYEDWAERLRRAGSVPEAREDRVARLYDEVEHDMMVRGGLGGGDTRRRGSPGGAAAFLGAPPAAGSHGHRGQAAAGGPRNHRHPDTGQHQDLGADGRQAG